MDFLDSPKICMLNFYDGETQRALLLSASCERTHEQKAICNPEEVVFGATRKRLCLLEPDHAGALISTFHPPEL